MRMLLPVVAAVALAATLVVGLTRGETARAYGSQTANVRVT
jgi:hypothetical protein